MRRIHGFRRSHVGAARRGNLGADRRVATAVAVGEDARGRKNLRPMTDRGDRFLLIVEMPDDFQHAWIQSQATIGFALRAIFRMRRTLPSYAEEVTDCDLLM